MSDDLLLSPGAGQVVCPVVVGRDAEIGWLESALAGARNGQGSLVLIVGEPGIGKSRLTREAEGLARSAGMRVLRGRAVPSAAPIPFRPIAEALQASLRRDGVPNDPELGPYWPALGAIVPEWSTATLAAEGSRVLFLEAVVRLLASLASRASGLLLVLEDLHWADADTLAVVDYLADNFEGERVLGVATLRDEPGAAFDLAEALAARRAAPRLQPARLSTDETAQMARYCLGATRLPPALLDPLDERAEGVPFVIEEMLTAYLSSGTEGGVPATLPHTFRELVRTRLDQVDGRTRRVLFAAAVLGRRFESSLLSDMTGCNRDEVLDSLRIAVQARLVTTDPASGFELPFGFRHALVREALLAELLPPELAELSARAAQTMEERFPGLPGDWCERVADLREVAGEKAAAARHLQEAAQRAFVRGALASAEVMLERARVLVAGDRWHTMGIDRQLVEVLSLAGKVERLREIGATTLAFALEKLERMGFLTLGLGDLHLALARGLATAGDDVASAEHLAQAREFALQLGEEHLLARVRAFEARRALEQGEVADARRAAGEARIAAERQGLSDVLSEALSVEGRAAFLAGEVEPALAALARACVEAGDAPLARLRALLELGAVEAAVTGYLESLHVARALAVESGAVSSEARADLLIGSALVDRFELEVACEPLARCVETCRRYRLALLQDALAAEGQRLALAGSEREAEAAIEEAGEAPLARAVLSLLREDRVGAEQALRGAASEGTSAALASLLGAVGGEAGGATESGSALAAGLLAFARAARLTGRAASKCLADGDERLVPFPWWRHLARRLVAEQALSHGRGDPAQWLREDLAFFEAAGHERNASACKALLRRAGAPVPRKRGHAAVPAELRARGVTSRELDVLRLIGEGLGNREIAARLFLSPRTVETHVARLKQRLDVDSRAGLAAVTAELDQDG